MLSFIFRFRQMFFPKETDASIEDLKRDIQNKSESLLREREDLFKRAEQLRIDFVANVSHELRTPLTSIKGYTDTLMEDLRLGRPVEIEYLDAISRNANRLMSLISDLLDLSSLESTEVLQKTIVATPEISSRAIKSLQTNFDAKKQTIEIKFGVDTISADVRRLEQVLINLLDNANKYTPVNGQIEVIWDQDESNYYLKIKDNGPGIPTEHQSRLFERFYRVDKARSREVGGTGLGLAIVKHIMQCHEGSISVENNPTKGSMFICQFPKK